jgi:hypothetical protein
VSGRKRGTRRTVAGTAKASLRQQWDRRGKRRQFRRNWENA